MKIKLTQSGWETYTGQMGILQFVDGLSVTDVPFRDAARMSAVMVCEFEDGSSCSPSQRLLDTAGVEAPVGRPVEVTDPGLVVDLPVADSGVEKPEVDEDEAARLEAARLKAEAEGKEAVSEGEDTGGEPVDPSLYTLDELSAIADSKGIAGLREIAGPMGIKSNSITGLIDELMKASAKKV